MAGAEAVLAQAAGGKVISATHAADDEVNDPSRQRGTDKLPHPVADQVDRHYASGDPNTRAHRRVDVAAGDGPNAVSRRDQAQSEGEGDLHDAYQTRETASNDRRSDAKEHQEKVLTSSARYFFIFALSFCFESSAHMHMRSDALGLLAASRITFAGKRENAAGTNAECDWVPGSALEVSQRL
jgi:hypothetical protein